MNGDLPKFQTRVVGRGVVGYDCEHCGVTHTHAAGEKLVRWSHCKPGSPLHDKQIVLLMPEEQLR